MGDVICVFRITPVDMGKFAELRKGLEKLKPQRLEEEPIAFGLKAFKFTKIVPDAEGTLPELEKKLESLKGVQNVESIAVSRSL